MNDLTARSKEKIQLVERPCCPLCGSESSTVHIAFPDIAVRRCTPCGMLYSGKLMTEESLRAYYKESFGSARQMQGQIVNSGINAWALERLVDMGQVRSVLDIGAGYGFFLKATRDRFGIEVAGVEPSEEESTYGRETFGLDIVSSSLEDLPCESRRYDVVTSFEVIEHIPNPLAFVSGMVERLNPGGHILLMTDNFESPVVKGLGPAFPKWIPHAHVTHFGPDTLEALARKAGLEIVRRMSFTPWELLAKRAIFSMRGGEAKPSNCYDITSSMAAERGGKSYPLFALRRCVNRWWALLNARADLEGELMYVLARRP